MDIYIYILYYKDIYIYQGLGGTPIKTVETCPLGRPDLIHDGSLARFRSLRAIRVRILVNKSDGKPEQLIEILDLIEPAAVIQLRELYPAALSIEADTLGSTTLQQAYRLMKAAKPAGVRLNLIIGAAQTVGAVDADPLGGLVGAVDGNPAGAEVYGGT